MSTHALLSVSTTTQNTPLFSFDFFIISLHIKSFPYDKAYADNNCCLKLQYLLFCKFIKHMGKKENAGGSTTMFSKAFAFEGVW